MLPAWLAPAESTLLRRVVYVRGLALVHLIATLSLWPQLRALVGTDGLMPAAGYLEWAWDSIGIAATWRAPTVLWLLPTDAGLDLICALSVGCALALLAGVVWEGPLLLLLWVCTVSLGTAGQVWLAYQWDVLLGEATFAALFVARWRPGAANPPTWGWVLQHWLLFRLMFFGGLAKLTSGDASWWDGTAMTYHYFTQPLPNPVSWYAHQLPGAIQALSGYAAIAIEVLLSLAMVLGLWGRRVAFGGFVLLMSLIALTGNYGWFQVLAIVLCFTLLDDRDWRRVLPTSWHVSPEGVPSNVLAPAGAALALVSLLMIPPFSALPAPLKQVVREVRPFQLVNRYGLFATMTQVRREIVFEGSADGDLWLPYSLPAKPVDVWAMPPQVAPHLPRLDWQLWFAGLQTCARNPWVADLQRKLADGDEAAVALFERNPFEQAPPRFVRTMLYDYTFAEPGGTAWWAREPVGVYCPVEWGSE